MFTDDLLKAAVANGLIATIGRRTVARIARYLGDAARLDVPNDIRSNGELMLQNAFLEESSENATLVVFDVGANIGDWTIPFLKRCAAKGRSNVSLHAFEPISSTMHLLETNTIPVETTAQLLLVKKAVSDSVGSSTIAVIEEGGGINAISPDPRQRKKYTEPIELTTIDHYCQENRIMNIGLIKVDTEGHDLSVLRGAYSMLTAKAIQLMQFEYNWRWVFSRAYLWDVFQLAEAVRYRLGKVTPLGIEFYDDWNPELEKFVEANYLLCRHDWADKLPTVRWWNLPRS